MDVAVARGEHRRVLDHDPVDLRHEAVPLGGRQEALGKQERAAVAGDPDQELLGMDFAGE